MYTTSSKRRVVAIVAAIACCILVATGVGAAVPPSDGPAPTTQLDIVGAELVPDGPAPDLTSPDRRHGEERLGVARGAAHWPVMQGTTSTGSAQGQLFGAVLVLLVLALIGAAALGVRPAVADRFDRAAIWRSERRGADGSDVGSPGRPTEEELLTDEERIIGLLEENGGRLKQQHVVETTDWSKAKVSRLLSSMEDEDAIVRIQLGREKLIFLSGHEPSGARSTLGEDR